MHQEKELVVENLCPNCENTNDEGSVPSKIGNTLNDNLNVLWLLISIKP